MRKSGITFQAVIIFTAIVFIIIIAIASIVGDINAWNDGYCECGGRWQYIESNTKVFANGEDVYAHNEYIYKCDKCGNMHSFTELR